MRSEHKANFGIDLMGLDGAARGKAVVETNRGIALGCFKTKRGSSDEVSGEFAGDHVFYAARVAYGYILIGVAELRNDGQIAGTASVPS